MQGQLILPLRDAKEPRWLRKLEFGTPNECWRVPTSRKDGYRYIKDGGKSVPAHRWAYKKWVGEISPSLDVDHLCRVRNCINPNHLEQVTHRENVLRGNTIAAMRAAQTHCVNGHPLSGDNLGTQGKGHRRCIECSRKCHRESQRRRRCTTA